MAPRSLCFPTNSRAVWERVLVFLLILHVSASDWWIPWRGQSRPRYTHCTPIYACHDGTCSQHPPELHSGSTATSAPIQEVEVKKVSIFNDNGTHTLYCVVILAKTNMWLANLAWSLEQLDDQKYMKPARHFIHSVTELIRTLVLISIPVRIQKEYAVKSLDHMVDPSYFKVSSSVCAQPKTNFFSRQIWPLMFPKVQNNVDLSCGLCRSYTFSEYSTV